MSNFAAAGQTHPITGGIGPAPVTLILCTPTTPGMDGPVYHLPYIEAVEGKRHGYKTRHGVQWTRNPNHPNDPRCPECGHPPPPAKPTQ